MATGSISLTNLLNRPPDRVQKSTDGKDMFVGWKGITTNKYIICKIENYKDFDTGMVRKWADGNYINPKEDWIDLESKNYKEI